MNRFSMEERLNTISFQSGRDNRASDQERFPGLNMIPIRRFLREEHDGKEVKNQDGAGVYHQLDREQAFRAQGDVQAGDMEEPNQQG